MHCTGTVPATLTETVITENSVSPEQLVAARKQSLKHPVAHCTGNSEAKNSHQNTVCGKKPVVKTFSGALYRQQWKNSYQSTACGKKTVIKTSSGALYRQQ